MAALPLFLVFLVGLWPIEGEGNALISSTVDWANELGSRTSLAGFLLGFDATSPNISLITPLQPKLWRIGGIPFDFTTITLLKSVGTQIVVTVSQFWPYLYPQSGVSWVSPASNLTYWGQFVHSLVSQFDDTIIWDIWNEPDSTNYWTDTQANFFATWKVAHDTIRSIYPTARITGPSGGLTIVGPFLAYLKSNSLKLDIINVHLFHPYNTIFQLSSDCQTVASYQANYSTALGIKDFHVGETIFQDQQSQPAGILAYLYLLEQGGVNYASKGCWPSPSTGLSGCYDHSLDGILTPLSPHEPTGAWWAYKAYTDSVQGVRVSGGTSNSTVIQFANINGSSAQILYAYFYTMTDQMPTINIQATMSHVDKLPFVPPGATNISVSIQSIPDTGESPLLSLSTQNMVLPIAGDGSVALTLLSVSANSSVIVTLSPAGGGEYSSTGPAFSSSAPQLCSFFRCEEFFLN